MGFKVRVMVTLDVDSRLDAVTLVGSSDFANLAGKAVSSVAAVVAGADPKVDWRGQGYLAATHVHEGYECGDCTAASTDGIARD